MPRVDHSASRNGDMSKAGSTAFGGMNMPKPGGTAFGNGSMPRVDDIASGNGDMRKAGSTAFGGMNMPKPGGTGDENGLGDRKSVVKGKSVSVLVELGGGRDIKKKNNNKNSVSTK